MTKYKFNQEAAKMGLPIYHIKKDHEITDLGASNFNDMLAVMAKAVYHTTNRIPYDPSKHPIKLNIVDEDGNRRFPFQVIKHPSSDDGEEYEVILALNNLGGGRKSFINGLFVQFDLEVIEE